MMWEFDSLYPDIKKVWRAREQEVEVGIWLKLGLGPNFKDGLNVGEGVGVGKIFQ